MSNGRKNVKELTVADNDVFDDSDIFFVSPYSGKVLIWLRKKGYPVCVTYYH